MKKSSEYLSKRLFLHFFLLLTVSIVYSIISGIIHFYNTNYHPDLMKLFIRTYVLNNMIFYLPAFILSVFAYTVNVSFLKKDMETLQIDKSWIFYKSFSIFIFILGFLIIFITLLTQNLTDINDKLELENNKIFLTAKRNKIINEKFAEIENLISKKDYYQAIDRANEILMMSPGNTRAEESIKSLKQLIENSRIEKLKELHTYALKLYKEKKYKEALKYFLAILNINPDDTDAQKYINIIKSLLSLETQKQIKDRYTSLVYFTEKNSPIIRRNKQIYTLAENGKKLFREKKYTEAQKYFKNILRIDLYNYDARVYLEKINTRLSEINYFTNREGKLIKRNVFFSTRHNNKKYLFAIEELRKTPDRHYILYNTTIYIFSDIIRTIKRKYGYLDLTKRVYIFRDSFLKENDIITIDFIYPKILWIREEILKTPEHFPIGELLKLKKFLQIDNENFIKLIIIKVNYYILTLFLFFLILPLSFYMRKKSSKSRYNFLTILLLPVFSYLLYMFYTVSFYTLKNFITAGFSVNILYGMFFNIIFYVLLYILLKIIINLVREPEIKKGKNEKRIQSAETSKEA